MSCKIYTLSKKSKIIRISDPNLCAWAILVYNICVIVSQCTQLGLQPKHGHAAYSILIYELLPSSMLWRSIYITSRVSLCSILSSILFHDLLSYTKSTTLDHPSSPTALNSTPSPKYPASFQAFIVPPS